MDESFSAIRRAVESRSHIAGLKREVASYHRVCWLGDIERKLIKPQNLFITFCIGFLTKIPLSDPTSGSSEQGASAKSSALMSIIKTIIITSIRTQILNWVNRDK